MASSSKPLRPTTENSIRKSEGSYSWLTTRTPQTKSVASSPTIKLQQIDVAERVPVDAGILQATGATLAASSRTQTKLQPLQQVLHLQGQERNQ